MVSANKIKTQDMVVAAALSAAVFIATIIIRIPIPATGGYVNLGDAVIIFTALTFGPVIGLIAGAIGSSAADLVGFPIFALPTLFIKGILGLIVGMIGRKGTLSFGIIGALTAEVWMVVGYFLTEAYIFSESMGIAAALSEVGFNAFQGIFGAIIGVFVWRLYSSRTRA